MADELLTAEPLPDPPDEEPLPADEPLPEEPLPEEPWLDPCDDPGVAAGPEVSDEPDDGAGVDAPVTWTSPAGVTAGD